ncbi:hypothetical protein ACN9ML_01570 [Dyadobacter endophyticus]|uniref:hypothetical protein n=1 Tax=Dyadobacter endophyticus TaxID=1749036 RepID=UPI003CF4B1E6
MAQQPQVGEKVAFPSPQATQLGKFGGLQVNHSSGTPNFNFPVVTVTEGTLQVPISLQYSYSGFRPGDQPGWVGMGFSLFAGGAVTRKVKGFADEMTGFGYQAHPNAIADFVNLPSPTLASYLANIDNNNDVTADVFSFQFNGYSGQMVIDGSGAVKIVSDAKIGITYEKGSNAYHAGTFIRKWVFKVEDGTRYTFTNMEFTGDAGPDHDFAPSAWNLSEIVDVKGNRIAFEYTEPNTLNTARRKQYSRFDQIYNAKINSGAVSENSSIISTNRTEEIFLTKIKGSSWELVFNSEAYAQSQPSTLDAFNGRRLNNIQLFNTLASPSAKVKQFNFGYLNNSGNRLHLLTVGEEGNAGHTFGYYSYAPSDIIGIEGSQDYWGYYNGQNNVNLIPQSGADLEPRLNLTLTGALTSVTYPTGGSTSIEYEQNAYSYVQNAVTSNSRIVVEEFFHEREYDSSLPNSLRASGFTSIVLTQPTRVDVRLNNSSVAPAPTNCTSQGTFLSNTLNAGTYTPDQILSSFNFYPCSHPDAKMPGFKISMNVKVFRSVTSNVNNYGGARVKTLVDNPNSSPGVSVSTNFTYNDPANANLSSGVVSKEPFFQLTFGNSQDLHTVYRSSAFNPEAFFPLYYRDVKVINDQYQTLYSFTSHVDKKDDKGKWAFFVEKGHTGAILGESSYTEIGDFGNYTYLRSLPKEILVTDLSGNPKKRTSYQYDGFTSNGFQVPAVHHELLARYTYRNSTYVEEERFIYYGKAYYIVGGWPRKISETVTDYGSSGENAVTTTTNFFYGTNHLQLNKRRVTRSDGSVLETNYKFPLDYISGGNSTLQAMITDNMVTHPVETVTYLEKSASDRKVIDANLTIYGSFTGNANKGALYLPQKEFRFRGFDGAIATFGAYNGSAEPVSGSSSYDEVYRTSNYDAQGNPLSVLLNGSEKVSYLWGYKGQFPVAQIRNADYSAVNSALSSAGSSFSAISASTSSADVRSKVDAVRNNLTSAFVTGYTYKPLVGMESMTDPAAKQTWYNYDNLGRLSDIREGSSTGNLLKSFHYNYANQGSFANGIVDNPDVSVPSSPGLTSGGSSSNPCAANRVKLLWRNYNHDRLVGATIQGSSNGADWEVLYQFPSNAPVGTWLTANFNNPQNYPHIRYNARATDGVGDLKEIRFYNVDGSGSETALTGTGFGSEPNLAGQGWANAIDGNETTQWHAEYVLPVGHPGNSNFVGISLPCATTLIKPTLYKSTNGDVCANDSPITLTASGFSEQLEWYLNDVLITGTQPGQTQYVATVAGSYKVRSKSGSSYSSFSNTIVLNQKAGCALPNYSRVVIVGNSITKLIAQSGSDGWQSPALTAAGGWGRASSTQAKDFAHILESRFKGLDPNAQVLPLWEAPFERDYISSPAGWVTYNYTALQNRIANSFGSLSWKPDLVIIRLGENVLNSEVELNNFKAAYNTLINKVLEVSSPGAKVIVTNSMWPDQPLANEKILQVATERGLPFVDLSDMISNPVYLAGNDPVSMAAFPNNTGDRHPGDAGMLEIAERIWAKVRNTDLPSNIGGNITRVRLSPRTECCMDRILGSVIQGSNDMSNPNGWTTLATISQTPAAGWNEYPIRTTTAWRYVRFLAGANSYGELKELEFYNGNVKLTGTKFGSLSAYNNDPANYGYANAFDGLVTTSWHGHTPGPTNYAGLDLGAGCASLTASVTSPANNASVVGTASTTTTGRVTTAISVTTCVPTGTTITSVEIWAATSTGGFPNRMGYAIADASQPGLYKLSADEGSANGKWPIPYLEPGTYRFYAKVNTASGTFTTDYITVTLTAPAGTGCPSLTASVTSPANNASVVGTASTVTAGRVVTAISVTTCVPPGTTITSVEIWASTTSDTFHNLMGYAIADGSQPGVYKLLAEEGSANGKWPAALLDPGTYRFYAKVKTASTTFTTNYITLTLTAPPVTGCPTLTGSVISPANNASVVGTASTVTAGRVITAISVSTCVPTGSTITSVEIWASTTSDTFHNLMGKAVADGSQPGVYKLSAQEGSADGKWPAALLDPGTYRFYAKVKTASTTFTTNYITLTLTAPPVTGCPSLMGSVISPANNASVVGTASTVTAGRVITAISVNACAPTGSTITSVEIWASTTSDTFHNLMGYAVADGSQPGVYKLLAEEGSANGKWPAALLDPGTYRFYAKVKTASTTFTTNYITLTLTAPPVTGCSTVTGNMLSPANNSSVVGTASTTTAGRVITAISVFTCVPTGSTIASVEIWATTSTGTFPNLMGYAIADASQPGVYKLAAEEGSANGKWPAALLDPGTYRFYAKVNTASTTFTTNYITVTLTAPPVTGCPTLTGSVISPSNNASVVGTPSTVTAGRVITAISVSTCVPTGSTITSVEIWATTSTGTFPNRMGYAIADGSQPGVYKLAAEEGSANGKWPAALLDPGTYRFYAKVNTATTTFTTDYVTVTLIAPTTGCTSLTGSVLSPANNASVVGTASTVTAGRVITAISVSTCVPTGSTITSVEIWASTTSDTFHNRMGYAIADGSQPGVYKLSAQEGSANGKWPAALLDPGTYRFYAVVKTATATYTTAYNTITLTVP